MLSVEQVTFRYDRRSQPVLRNASLSLDAGQVGVLLGRTGCGKTTLLKTLLGLCRPEAGRITFDGEELTEMTRRRRAQIAAYVPQETEFGALQVYDAVLAGRVSRFGIQPGAADRAAAESAMEDMGLTVLAGRSVQTLSGGEKQKVAIARALAQEPRLLIFDEPTGNLDIANEQRILRQARQLSRSRGMTVLCTLHDLNQALSLGDRFFFLKDGVITCTVPRDGVTSGILRDALGGDLRLVEVEGERIVLHGRAT